MWADSYLKLCPVWTSWTRLGTSPRGGADGWRRRSKIGVARSQRGEGGPLAPRVLASHLKPNNEPLPFPNRVNAEIIDERQRFGNTEWNSVQVASGRRRWVSPGVVWTLDTLPR